MLNRIKDILRRRVHLYSVSHWKKAAEVAKTAESAQLRELRQDARFLKRYATRVIRVANNRLTLPRIGSTAIHKPAQTDWSYRPELWREAIDPRSVVIAASGQAAGEETAIHHDCGLSEICLRQLRNHRKTDLAPFGVRLDVLGFEGSFLALTVDLPVSSVEGLTQGHIFGLSIEFETEMPLDIFARLNIKSGPNVAEVVEKIPSDQTKTFVEFDLAHVEISLQRLEKIWVGLSFGRPAMNEIYIRDLTLTRRPRAEF